jgi:ectoine hydroxylase-related dioxygenase (phytanoyl-CoA dioxygenase family)
MLGVRGLTGGKEVKAGITYAHAPAHALERIVALRVHLDPSNTDNGPLRVLPGTHTLGVLPDASLWELPSRIPAYECVVPRGGVLLMRPLLVHASSKAISSTPRRVIHIEYANGVGFESGLELAIA